MPTIINRFLVGKCFENRVDFSTGDQGRPKYIVLHIQQGTNPGSFSHFSDPNVQASATVLIGRNGEIWRLIHEEDGPWTNGDVDSPTSKAVNGILAEGGNPNIWTLSIETEGYTFAPNAMGWGAGEHPEAQVAAIVWQVQDWASRYQIPSENFLRHADINSVSKDFCPGNDLFDRVKSSVPGWGGLGTTCTPVPPPPFDGSEKQVNNVVFHPDQRRVTVNVPVANVRRWAERDACEVRAPLTAGDEFNVLYWIEGEAFDGEDRWWVTPFGSRIHVSATAEKPNDGN